MSSARLSGVPAVPDQRRFTRRIERITHNAFISCVQAGLEFLEVTADAGFECCVQCRPRLDNAIDPEEPFQGSVDARLTGSAELTSESAADRSLSHPTKSTGCHTARSLCGADVKQIGIRNAAQHCGECD